MIYSVCKCDTRPSVRCLTREEKKRFGDGLQAVLESKAKISPLKGISKVEMSAMTRNY